MTPLEHLSDDEFGHLVRRAVQALPDPPAALEQAALALWPQAGVAGVLGSAAGLVQAVARHVVAQLSFDSWASPALASGMRSGRSAARHLLFTAEGRDIDLRVTAAADGFALSGQVLGPDEHGAVELVALNSQGANRLTVALDELGAFRFDAVDAGRYQLTLRLGTDALVLPPLDVGARAG
jgi:hypothetical protein